MKETFKQMLDRHQDEISKFRLNCKHSQTELMEYFWAPGHGGGMVRCCKKCGLQLESAHKAVNNSTTTIDNYGFLSPEEFLSQCCEQNKLDDK